MFYIYIIKSASRDKFYVGYTNNPWRRLEEHNTGFRNTFTSKYRPWEMAALFECSEEEEKAVRAERFIKKQKSRRLIERMISGQNLNGELAQLVRVPHVRD